MALKLGTNPIRRLDAWRAAGESRCVTIDTDDGFGRGFWRVLLYDGERHLSTGVAEFELLGSEDNPRTTDARPGLAATVDAAMRRVDVLWDR